MSAYAKLVVRDAGSFERVAFAEVLVPEVPNVYGDLWTKDKIREAAYLFAKEGYGIDVNHDNEDVTGQVTVIESFIAREGDPDFIEGSWVVGVQVHDETLWQQILDGEINGFSYEAIVSFLQATFTHEDSGVRSGVTEADPTDGHTHDFLIIVDDVGRAVSGGTSVTNGHSHSISGSVITEESEGHKHRFNIVKGENGI